MRRLPAVAGAALLVALAACGSASQDPGLQPSDPFAAKDHALRGRTFVSTAVTVDGGPRPLVGGTDAVVGFTDDGLTLHAGCNQMSARAAYADGRLTVDGVGGTEMGCEPALMEQDAWLAGFLADDPRYLLDGDSLTLTGGDTVMELRPEPDEPAADLAGTRWRLDGVVEGRGADASVSSIPADVHASLSIDDGRLGLRTGCNAASGSVDVSGPTLTVSIDSMSDAGCSPEPHRSRRRCSRC